MFGSTVYSSDNTNRDNKSSQILGSQEPDSVLPGHKKC